MGCKGLAALLRRTEALRQLQHSGGHVIEEKDEDEEEDDDDDGSSDNDGSGSGSESGTESAGSAEAGDRRRKREGRPASAPPRASDLRRRGGSAQRRRGAGPAEAAMRESDMAQPVQASAHDDGKGDGNGGDLSGAPGAQEEGMLMLRRPTSAGATLGSWDMQRGDDDGDPDDPQDQQKEDDDDDSILPPMDSDEDDGDDEDDEDSLPMLRGHRRSMGDTPSSAGSGRPSSSSSGVHSRPPSGASQTPATKGRPWSAAGSPSRPPADQAARMRAALDSRKLSTRVLAVEGEVLAMRAEMGAVQHTLHNMATDFSQLAAVVQRLIDVTGLDQPPPPPPHNADSLPEGESRMAWAYSVVGEQDRSKIEGDLTTLASDGPAAGLGLPAAAHRELAAQATLDSFEANRGVPRAEARRPHHNFGHRSTTLGLRENGEADRATSARHGSGDDGAQG